MTRADLRDWYMVHNCEITTLNEWHKGNAVRVTNPKNGNHVFLDMPIDERPVKNYLVCKTCMQLGIPIPDFCKDAENLAKHIKDKHYPNFGQ